MPSYVRQVGFAESVQVARPAKDDEVYVMKQYSRHASHCSRCSQPTKSHLKGQELCERGQAYAKDVAKYIYVKGGKPYSMLDRERDVARVQIEIPADCEVIRDLVKAVDMGLRLPKNKPVIAQPSPRSSPERSSPVVEQRGRAQVEIRVPQTRRAEPKSERKTEKIYIKGGGSLFRKDEEERRQRTRNLNDEDPIIIRASPGVRVREYRR